MGQFASGVTVVTTVSEGKKVGLTASSFASLSVEPPLVLVCLAKKLYTHRAIEESGVFAVNILGAHQLDLGLRFAGMKPEVIDRFADLELGIAKTGAPLLTGSLASVDCRLWNQYEGGDHSIFVGEVQGIVTSSLANPLLYHDRLWRRTESITSPSVPVMVELLETHPLAARIENAFGEPNCPFDSRDTARAVREHKAAGAAEILLVDSKGGANPQSVRKVVQEVWPLLGQTLLSVELSDGRGMGLANLLSALKSGVGRFVTSPHPRLGEAPPVLTASALAMLTEMGVDTRVVEAS